MKSLTSIRMPKITDDQIEALKGKTGLNQSEIITTAIDRMYREEIKMNETVDRITQINWVYALANKVHSNFDYSEAEAKTDGVSKSDYVDYLMTAAADYEKPSWFDDHDRQLLREQLERLVTEL